MLLAGDGGKITGDQKTFLDEIYRSSTRMVKLVNELLNVSRLETGRLKIEPQSLDLTTFIQDIIHEIEPWSSAWNRTIVFMPPAQPVCHVAIDPTLMRQVIHNLITNAVRYSPPDEAEIRVKLQQTDQEYTVSVADDGIGIPKEAQSRIFQKFFRVDNARVREAEGSGIGLYIAKMIVDASGGKLWFESPTKPDGSGTTFYLTIPTTGMIAHDGEKGLA